MINTYIGIDPGTQTGIAIWSKSLKRFSDIETVQIHVAFDIILRLKESGIHVRFEDARQRTWFGHSGREVLQGAGSIKRDCSIWEDFLTAHNIPFEAVKPAAKATKWKADYFKKVTGWEARTSEHSRDAAILVFNK